MVPFTGEAVLDVKATVETLRSALGRIPAGAPTDAVFQAVGRSIPMHAGFLDRFLQGASHFGLMYPHGIDRELVNAIMSARTHDTPLVLATVAATPCGHLIRDQDVAGVIDWSDVAGYRALNEHGLGHPAAVKIGVRSCGADREHTYLALIQKLSDPPLTRQHRAILRRTWKDIRDAVARVRVPLIAGEPMLLQVAEERRMGLALCTLEGNTVQTNYLVHEHAREYFPTASSPTWSAVDALAECLVKRAGDGGTQLVHPLASCVLRADRHLLCGETHGMGRDMVLIVTQEFDVHRLSAENVVMRRLPPRLQETARHLVHSGRSYKQIAAAMGVREGTVRKHVERLYRAVGVRSRWALARALGSVSE